VFGLFKRRSQKPPVCRVCGEPLAFVHTGEAGADDLLKSSKLWRDYDTGVCLRCRYNYYPDRSDASETSTSESLSAGEQNDLVETSALPFVEDDHEPGLGYQSGGTDAYFGDDGAQEHKPDVPYKPGNGYRTDDEIGRDNDPLAKLTDRLLGTSPEFPAPARRVLVRILFFAAIYLGFTFWPDQNDGNEIAPKYIPPETSTAPLSQVGPMPGAFDSAVRTTGNRSAIPVGNVGQWIMASDYPVAALREERSGTVGFQLEIGSSGEVTGCNIVESSGHADLDQASCGNLMRRARFSPARDANGEPVASSYSNKVRWEIPQ
jgi:TonB family protein